MDKKQEQLGMPFGTAQNKLRKSILYYLIGQLNLRNCYRCNLDISNINELSIEHKEDWLDNNPLLFWDLNNIAFSHKRCNYKNARKIGGYGKRKIGPEGTSWCPQCELFQPLDLFYKDAERWNSKRRLCKNHFNRERGRIV